MTAIYELSNNGSEATSIALGNFLGIKHRTSLHSFFQKNKFIAKYVDIIIGTPLKPSKYILTDKGKEVVSLIYHFRNFYINF